MDGSAYTRMGDAVTGAFRAMIVLLVLSVPLAIWKLVDIAIWAAGHVSVGFH